MGAEGYSNTALDKLLAAIGGWRDIRTRLRCRYRYFGEDTVSSLRRAFREEAPEFGKLCQS